MKTYTAKLHIRETHIDSVYGRVYVGWMSGEGLGHFGALSGTRCAMTQEQASEYKISIEAKAREFNQSSKIDGDGNPVEVKIELDFELETLAGSLSLDRVQL